MSGDNSPGWINRQNRRQGLYSEIEHERLAQDRKWGGPAHDDEHTADDWKRFLADHLHRAFAAGPVRKQLLRVAALAIAAVESMDRETAGVEKLRKIDPPAGAPRSHEEFLAKGAEILSGLKQPQMGSAARPYDLNTPPPGHRPVSVEHPAHYAKLQPEPIDAIRSWGLNFNLGCAVKYCARADHKGEALSDLKKAAYYLKHEIERRTAQLELEAIERHGIVTANAPIGLPLCMVCRTPIEAGAGRMIHDLPYHHACAKA